MSDEFQNEERLLARITVNPEIFGGKPIIRGRRLAVEHILGMLAAGDTAKTLLEGYPWLEMDDIRACLAYARRLVGHEREAVAVWMQSIAWEWAEELADTREDIYTLADSGPVKQPQVFYGAWKDKFPEDVDLDLILSKIRGEWS